MEKLITVLQRKHAYLLSIWTGESHASETLTCRPARRLHSLPRGLAEVGKDLLLGSSFARQVRTMRSPLVCWTDGPTDLLDLLH